MANWMKRPIFFTSFFSINCAGSNCLISPAICELKRVGSNDSMREMPLLQTKSDCQFSSVVAPIAESRPTPVTTTLREIEEVSFLILHA